MLRDVENDPSTTAPGGATSDWHTHDVLDGTGAVRCGAVRCELLPLFEALRQMRRPRSGFTWASRLDVQQLRTLARERRPLSHAVLNELRPRRAVPHLRDLLMHHGVLPPADRDLLLFEAWLADWLPTIGDREHRQTLNHFVRWHILRRLRDITASGPIGSYHDKQARLHITRAVSFLEWLANNGVDLGGCTQANLDAWQAEDYLDRRHAQPFLRWCMDARRVHRLRVPTRATDNPAPLDQHQR
ncbi:MAG: hypothetical protein GEV04_23510, partial [Actinophytocola sp.]|nr:hypothetical protein [Actinophytocola sp.]